MRKNINGLTINYRVRCNKNRDNFILFLHGWGGSLDSFKGVEDILVKQGFSIINLDFPGFGLSEIPPNNFTLNDYKNLIVQILKIENITKVNVVAHSFGGRVAILLASETDVVNKLVLVDSAGIKPKFNFIKWCKIRNYKLKKWLNSHFKTKFDLSKYGSEDYRALPKSMKPVFNNIVNENLKSKLKNIKSQTLLVWGDKDKSTPLYMGKIMNKKIKKSDLIIYKGCGHFSYIEKFNEFCLKVEKFLDN